MTLKENAQQITPPVEKIPPVISALSQEARNRSVIKFQTTVNEAEEALKETAGKRAKVLPLIKGKPRRASEIALEELYEVINNPP